MNLGDGDWGKTARRRQLFVPHVGGCEMARVARCAFLAQNRYVFKLSLSSKVLRFCIVNWKRRSLEVQKKFAKFVWALLQRSKKKLKNQSFSANFHHFLSKLYRSNFFKKSFSVGNVGFSSSLEKRWFVYISSPKQFGNKNAIKDQNFGFGLFFNQILCTVGFFDANVRFFGPSGGGVAF